MRDDSEERIRNLRGGIGAVIEILEGVKERTRGFALKQVEAEKASLETHSKFDDQKTRLAEKISKLESAEGRLATRHRDNQLYLNWLAVNNKLAIIAYLRRLRQTVSMSNGSGNRRTSQKPFEAGCSIVIND